MYYLAFNSLSPLYYLERHLINTSAALEYYIAPWARNITFKDTNKIGLHAAHNKILYTTKHTRNY